MSPEIHYPLELPVSQHREEIARAISNNQVVIVAGATGSGKTTQLPKICLELGRKSIGHTQPRRLAARTIAERIATELGTELGGLVGFQVRFTDRVSANTRIKLMTDGILLNELHRDRMLRKYDTIIIDEAHERSLNVDFLLGYLKQLLPKRPELKVIVTSATIDPESFAKHFEREGKPAPIIEVSGRTFPVEIRYRPSVPTVSESAQPALPNQPAEPTDVLDALVSALDELANEAPGDVLVFFSGENEIRDAAELLNGRKLKDTEVLPLYGRLSASEQLRVFTAKPAMIKRRIVLATNVAETSLTVPGIKYVIDTGTARISRYSTRSKIQQLPIEAISKASANQRSGRAGRTSAGIAIRLYSEDEFQARAEYTDPEILRTNLASVILQMLALGLGELAKFPFLQPPDPRGVKAGQELLVELGAIDKSGAITKIGRTLATLPIDPRFGRMIIEANQNGVVREVLAIVAGLSIQDPRERPLEKQAQADQLHTRFVDKSSDFLGLLNLWRYLKKQEKSLSGNAFRKTCRNEYLNYMRVREWGDVYRQLKRFARDLGFAIGEAKDTFDENAIHRSLLAGLLSQLGIRDEKKDAAGRQKGDYLGSRNVRFSIFPGSALAKKKPAEIMSAELVETSRLFARTNAVIDLAWAEPLAGELAKRTFSEPHWEKRQGSAVVFEKVTLFGLPIVERRRIQLSRLDPALAREIFIRSALVEGEMDTHEHDRKNRAFEFLRANSSLREHIEDLEERTRQRGLLVGDEVVFTFYEARIPQEVTDQRSFERWWRDARGKKPDLLNMTIADLVDTEDEDLPQRNAKDFPAHWIQEDQKFNLDYRFDPGTERDGVTVEIPLPLLPRTSPVGFDWQVPGLRKDLVAALLKTLPKPLRRAVVPVSDWVPKLLSATETDDNAFRKPITTFLAEQIRVATFTTVSPNDFDWDRVPDHLKLTFAAIDAKGTRISASKSLEELKRTLQKQSSQSVAKVVEAQTDSIERSGLKSWDFEDLPEFIDAGLDGRTIRAYPGLFDEQDTVSIKLFSTSEEQTLRHQIGVRRLLALSIPSPASYVREHLTDAEKLALARNPYKSLNALFDDCLLACADDVLQSRTIRQKAKFEAAREQFSNGVVDALFATVSLVSQVLESARTVEKAIEAASNIAFISPLSDARSQLQLLVFDGFVSSTGLRQLRRLPTYLAAINHRISVLEKNPGRDRVNQTEIEKATAKYVDSGGSFPVLSSAPEVLQHARWLLEELRISLFAQQLGTAEPVSLARISKLLNGD